MIIARNGTVQPAVRGKRGGLGLNVSSQKDRQERAASSSSPAQSVRTVFTVSCTRLLTLALMPYPYQRVFEADVFLSTLALTG